MQVSNDHRDMHPMVKDLGTDALILDRLPRIPIEEQNPWESCSKKIIIVFQSRTGTTWLCELMKKTGVLGLPRESLHANSIVSEYEEGNFQNFNHYMQESVNKHSTDNGVYAAKSGFFSLAPLFILGEFPNNIREWKIIFVKRRDVLEQAISIHKLNLNRQSASWEESVREIKDEDYSFEEISKQIRNVHQANQIIETMISTYGADAMNIFYEDMSENPEKTIREIGDFVGVELGAIDIETRFKIQRNELSEIWKKRWESQVIDKNPLFQRLEFFG